MLKVKNKSIFLLWELNSIFMYILREKFCCIDHQNGRLVTWLQTKNSAKLCIDICNYIWWSFMFCTIDTDCYSLCVQLERSHNHDRYFQKYVWITVLSTHCQVQRLLKLHHLLYTKGLFNRGVEKMSRVKRYFQKKKLLKNYQVKILAFGWSTLC